MTDAEVKTNKIEVSAICPVCSGPGCDVRCGRRSNIKVGMIVKEPNTAADFVPYLSTIRPVIGPSSKEGSVSGMKRRPDCKDVKLNNLAASRGTVASNAARRNACVIVTRMAASVRGCRTGWRIGALR